jgi:hypothetical protein
VDPLSLASAFATIVGLIGQFRSERNSDTPADFGEFSAWLAQNQREDLLHLLEQHKQAISGVEVLLREQESRLLAVIDRLDRALASAARNYPGFSDIAEVVRPYSSLSRQALSILTYLDRQEVSGFSIHRVFGGSFVIQLANAKYPSEKLDLTEERFVENDLSTLVQEGLLLHDGTHGYTFTRAASDLVERMQENG